MSIANTDRIIRQAQAWALLALPGLLALVFALHFHSFENFFVFRAHYVPRPAQDVVRALIAAGNRGSMMHDPHVIAYLSLPLVPLCAFGLYALGRQARPAAAATGISITMTGTIYAGGLFGMWTAFYRGLGDVDPKYIEGAIATFAAQSAPHGAFLLTTTLSKLALIGLAVQILVLSRTRRVPNWSVVAAALGCALILVFWDLDNWMLIGAVLMLIGFVPMSRLLRTEPARPVGS